MVRSAACDGAVSALVRRAMAAKVVRRLVVVGGLVILGWLFGSTLHVQQASAETEPYARVVHTLPQGGVTAEKPDGPVRIAVRHALNVRPRLSVPVKRAGSVLAYTKYTRYAQYLKYADKYVGHLAQGTDGVSWTPRHRTDGGTDVGRGGLAGAQAPGAATTSGASKDAGDHRDGKAAKTPVDAHPAPATLPPAPHGDALLPAAGSASGGAAGGVCGGYPDSAGSLPRPRPALVPATGTLSPAVRTATDEPSFAPD